MAAKKFTQILNKSMAQLIASHMRGYATLGLACATDPEKIEAIWLTPPSSGVNAI